MTTYRSRRKQILYSIAKKQIDMPGGWDHWWYQPSEMLSAKAQRAQCLKLLRDPNKFANEDGSLDPHFKLCKHTLEIQD